MPALSSRQWFFLFLASSSGCMYDPLALKEAGLACPEQPGPCRPGETCTVAGANYVCSCGGAGACDSEQTCLPNGTCNTRPQAVIENGSPVLYRPGGRDTTIASASYDADGDTLSTSWTLTGCFFPLSSTSRVSTEPELGFTTAAAPAGPCSVTLVVSDGAQESLPATAQLFVIDADARAHNQPPCVSTFTLGATGEGTMAQPYCSLANAVAAAEAYALRVVRVSTITNVGDVIIRHPLRVEGGYSASSNAWTRGATSTPLRVTRSVGLELKNPTLSLARHELSQVAIYRDTDCTDDCSQLKVFGASVLIEDSSVGGTTAAGRATVTGADYTMVEVAGGSVPITVDLQRTTVRVPERGAMLSGIWVDGSGDQPVTLTVADSEIRGVSYDPSVSSLIGIASRDINVVSVSGTTIELMCSAHRCVGLADGTQGATSGGAAVTLVDNSIRVENAAQGIGVALSGGGSAVLLGLGPSGNSVVAFGRDRVVALETVALTSLDVINTSLNATLQLPPTSASGAARSGAAWSDGLTSGLGSSDVHVTNATLTVKGETDSIDNVAALLAGMALQHTRQVVVDGTTHVSMTFSDPLTAEKAAGVLLIDTHSVSLAGTTGSPVTLSVEAPPTSLAGAAIMDGEPGSRPDAALPWPSRPGSRSLALRRLSVVAILPPATNRAQRAGLLLSKGENVELSDSWISVEATPTVSDSPIHAVGLSGSKYVHVHDNLLELHAIGYLQTIASPLPHGAGISDGYFGTPGSTEGLTVERNSVFVGDAYSTTPHFIAADGVWLGGVRTDRPLVSANGVLIKQAIRARGIYATNVAPRIINNTMRVGACAAGASDCNEWVFGMHLDRPALPQVPEVINNLISIEGGGERAGVVERHGSPATPAIVEFNGVSDSTILYAQTDGAAPTGATAAVLANDATNLRTVFGFCEVTGFDVPPSSPAGGNADPSRMTSPDLYGTPRPLGDPDIGAVEFDEGLGSCF